MARHENVSNQNDELILVDDFDGEIGFMSKYECHTGQGVLHRAFSIFIFDNQGKVLLQQRSGEKWLWPHYWSNSCCSHPRRGEPIEDAIHRRLDEELGISCALNFLYKFKYHAQFEDVGSENELCSVYYGIYDGQIDPNQSEIAEYRFLSPQAISENLANDTERYTPWFQMEWAVISEQYRDRIDGLQN